MVGEALDKFGVLHARCVHRSGLLELGECAVWVGVSSGHRDEAFLACRYIIDEVKVRLPIWKKEHYVDGHSGWVNCERCATHGHSHDKLLASASPRQGLPRAGRAPAGQTAGRRPARHPGNRGANAATGALQYGPGTLIARNDASCAK